MKRIQWLKPPITKDPSQEAVDTWALHLIETGKLWTQSGDHVIVRDSPKTVFVARITQTGILREDEG